MDNFKQKEFTSKMSGKTYTLQHPGVRAIMRMNDASKNKHGVTMEERLSDEVLKHVVVNPKVKMDDFETLDEFNELIIAASNFISGVEEDGDNDDNQERGRSQSE